MEASDLALQVVHLLQLGAVDRL
jgi:hypothetical protein